MNWKPIVIGLFAIAVVIAGIVYLSTSKDIIKQATPSFAPEQRATLERSLQDAQKQVDEITDDMSEEERALRHFKLGRAHYILGNYEKGRNAFRKAVSIKKNIPIYLEYYNLLTAMRDYEGARRIARDALKIYPFNIDIWRSLIALEKSQFEADAGREEELLMEAFRATQEHPDIAADLGRFYESQNNPTEAVKYWQVAARRAPEVLFYAEQVKRLEGN